MRTPASGRGSSTPPRPPAAGKPQQWFVLRPWLYDVTAAAGLLRAAPRPPQPLPVEPWARAYGLIPAPASSPHTVSLIGPGPGFDPQYAMGTDLDEPVIIATLTSPAGAAAGPLLRYKEVAPMTDKISQRPVPPLDPPERFAGGEVVAAARCPVDVSTYPRRHVIVVKHAGECQTFSVHEVAHNHVEWGRRPGTLRPWLRLRHPSRASNS